MNTRRSFIATTALLSAAIASADTPLGTAITYQGQLKESGAPAGGTYDLQFTLFDAAAAGAQVGSTLCFDGVSPDDGLFTLSLDFGAGAFTGSTRWLEIGVRADVTPGNCNIGAYTTLSTRQPLAAAPYALYAINSPAGSEPWATGGANIYNTNAGSVGIGDDQPLAFLHVGPEHLALGIADLHSEDVIIAGGDGVLGIYSDSAGGAGNGSAIALGEIGAGLTDKWGIFRDTNAAGSDLHISYGANPDYAVNSKFMTFDAATGSVGIGASAPDARLHVAGDFRATGRVALGNEGIFGADILFERVFDFTHRVTDFNTSAFFLNPFHAEVFADPPADTTMPFVGYKLTARSGIGNPNDLDFVGGCDITAVHSGTGVIDTLRGAAVFTSAAGPVNTQIGLAVSSDGLNSATIGDNRALEIRSGHRTAGGSITDDYALFVNTPSRNSPLTNHYGIYLANQGSPSAFPTSYAIYADGGQSYFKDAIGVGVTSPQSPLHIGTTQAVTRMVSSNHASGSVLVLQNDTASPIYFGAINFQSNAGGTPGQIGYLASQEMTFRVNGAEQMRIDDLGNVGIGTIAPAVPLHVAGGGDVSPSGGGYFVIGAVDSANIGMDQNEIMARNNGVASDLFINHNGGNVLFQAGGGTGGIGVGTSTPTRGKVDIDVANQRGIYGTNNSATFATAYFDNIGTGPAGVFDGSVSVIGSLSKSSGSFRIDHPLDPANKYLYHSFVESPDMMNVYNGNVVTDDLGYATVTMPDWFETLNRDFRYQLTVIGQFAQAIVAEELRDGAFVIRTDKPSVKVSWQITGIRQDPWAESHRIPVEQDKPGHERGRYQHPELYGQPREMSINHIENAEPAPEAQVGE